MVAVPTPWLIDPGDPIEAARSGAAGWLWRCVRAPSSAVVRHVKLQDLCVVDPTATSRPMFDAAEVLIDRLPSLAAVVMARVCEIHVLAAEPDYDVSHSEPHWPSRILVSIPVRSDEIGALRLAESVIHEAMHLHLTQFEAAHPLVRREDGVMPSPWRTAPRPYAGVMHGLFVFSCLRAYFDAIRPMFDGKAARHLEGRARDIASEVASIDIDQLSDGLTPHGRRLARGWWCDVVRGRHAVSA